MRTGFAKHQPSFNKTGGSPISGTLEARAHQSRSKRRFNCLVPSQSLIAMPHSDLSTHLGDDKFRKL